MGWHNRIGEFEAPKGVIGIVVAQKFPEPELIRLKLIEGISRVHPDTVWVMRDAERKGHAANVAWDTFREYEIEPFLAPLVPDWQRKAKDGYVAHVGPTGRIVWWERLKHVPAYDHRASWRDAEMRSTCERIILFHDASSNVTAEWKDCEHSIAKIYTVERGKKKRAPAKRGKAPVGA